MAHRTAVFVRTSFHCHARLTYLFQSWIPSDRSKQSNLYLITDHASNSSDSSAVNLFQNIVETHCPETHNRFDLCCKTAHEFDTVFKLMQRNADLDWMCRFDDDQYVNLDNLYDYLSPLNASQLHYIGRTSTNQRLKVKDDPRTFSFATYGAGVCFSRALLERLRPHTEVDNLPKGCLKLGISDDAYVGYLSAIVLNASLTANHDLFHSHLEKLDQSFRLFSMADLRRAITFGFAWDRYKLDWLPVIHQLIQLIRRGEEDAANRLWLFLRQYEREHPENLTDRYDQSCASYQRLRKQPMALPEKRNATMTKPAR